jgi:exonuclease SbcC
MLLSIGVENWRSHKDTKLQFDKGTNLLIGIMGSGKSSILDAISFALFGTFPALERRKLSLFDVIRLNEQNAKAELEFLWNGERYRVVRMVERKKDSTATDAEMYKNDRIVEKGTTAVNKYVEQLLHVDYDLFTRAIYSEQNNIDYFLMLDPKRRKQEMDALLGLDRFEEARANCTSLLNRVKNNRKDLEMRFSREKLADSQKQLSKVGEKIAILEKEGVGVSSRITDMKAQCTAKERGFSDIKAKKESYEKTAREALVLETRANTLKKDIEGKTASESELKEVSEQIVLLERERNQAGAILKDIEKNASSLNLRIGSIDAKIKIAQKNKDEQQKLTEKLEQLTKGKTREELVSEYDGLQSIVQTNESEVQFMKSKTLELEDSLKRLKPGTAECPVCGNELDEKGVEDILEKKQGEIQSLAKGIESKTKNALEQKQKLVGMRDNIRNVELLSSRLEAVSKDMAVEPLGEELKKLNAENEILKKEKEKLAERTEKLANELKELQSVFKEKELLLKKIILLNDTEENLVKTKELLLSMNYDEKTYETLQAELENIRIELEKTSAEKMRNESELKSNREIRTILERELKNTERIGSEITSLIKLEEELSIYKNALVQTQASMRSELIESINEAMNEIWGIFYPYRDYKMLRLSASEKDYQFEVYDREWKTLESVASGGERACAALTLRVALAMVLTPNLSWLILDEPTHNLDKEAVELLSQTLQTKVPEVVDQTFVITHEEALMGSDFASSYRLSRDKENLESTKVEKI